MIFCGRTFCGSRNSIDYTSSNISNINKIDLQNGIYDAIVCSTNTKDTYTTIIPDKWDYYTVFNAQFNGNLEAGNTGLSLAEADSILIKREEDGTGNWITLFNIPVIKDKPIDFVKFDTTAKANTVYNYALIPVTSGVEGEMSIQSVKSEFEGIFLLEKDKGYHALINITMSLQKNRPSIVINTIDRRYPYVVTNGNNNYWSGSTSAIFVKTSDNIYDWQWFDSTQYRNDIYEFLCDGKPKILKHFDGRVFLISVVENPTLDENISNYYPTTIFNWVEIGDANSSQDLYDNNIIDYNGRTVLTEPIQRSAYYV